LKVDDFAPRLSFFFNAHNDFFEEIAKYRAARRMWAHLMQSRFGAKDERSWKLRFHTQTAGCTLTDRQPINNVARVAIQALAGVLGGTQSLHTNSMDETLALPTEKSATIALRTQQILSEETGVIHTADPLGGSYYVEALTDRIEAVAGDTIRRLDEMGGMVAAIEAGFPQNEIAKAAYHYQQQIEQGEKAIVGVTKYVDEEEIEIPTLMIGEEVEREQCSALEKLRRERDNRAVESRISALVQAAERGENLMPCFVEAVKVYATLGEICNSLKKVYGEYREPFDLAG
ncbi:MAG: methylmalonyl-CoA mutase, partial [Deltaproteobacteria bacterium]|nr:methylmalonyl-CoA mutase [Deltaproteobacteria bacterium]